VPFAATAVLPLPWAALAMIAQRKPNNDKGFEEFAPEMRVFWGARTFLTDAPW
jgi:hypothetical protein